MKQQELRKKNLQNMPDAHVQQYPCWKITQEIQRQKRYLVSPMLYMLKLKTFFMLEMFSILDDLFETDQPA